MTATDWSQQAACRGLPADLFYSDHNDHQALHICRVCPVMWPCRYWALEYPDWQQHGTAGGLTATQRCDIRRQWSVLDTTVMRYRRADALHESWQLRQRTEAA